MSEHTVGKAIIQHLHNSPQLCIEVPYWEQAIEAASHPTFIATIYGPHPEEDARRIVITLNSYDDLLAALEEWSAPYIDYVGLIDSDIGERLERTRAAITKAKKCES